MWQNQKCKNDTQDLRNEKSIHCQKFGVSRDTIISFYNIIYDKLLQEFCYFCDKREIGCFVL